MASKYWIKFYIEALDDPKVARLPDNLWRRYYECCLLAGEMNQGGKLQPIAHIAWRLRVDEETLATEFDALARIGILDHKVENVLDGGYWYVTNFDKRQAPVPGAVRVAQHRETKKKQKYYDTDNEDVTYRYTDIESDTDTESDIEVGRYSRLSAFFVGISNISELTGGAIKWSGAIKAWVDAGLEEQDIQEAYNILIEKNYTVAGPWSVTNTAIGVMTKRKANKAKVMASIPKAQI